MIRVGDLVRDFDGKLGVVTEVEKEHEGNPGGVAWTPVWVKWNGNSDWEIAYETDLEIISQAWVGAVSEA